MSIEEVGKASEALHEAILGWIEEDANDCSGYELSYKAGGIPELTMHYYPIKKILGSKLKEVS